jgi:perosamine synthetase
VERHEELRRGRARVATAYERAIGGHDWLSLPRAGEGEILDWFVYVVRLHPDIDRDRLIDRLADIGVPSRPYFARCTSSQSIGATFGFRPGDFPVTERVAASTLALPFLQQARRRRRRVRGRRACESHLLSAVARTRPDGIRTSTD